LARDLNMHRLCWTVLFLVNYSSAQDSKLSPLTGENATLYHYYPHNQHIFSLPECASQQVCNAVYLRLNFSTPLCACPAEGDPCSASTLADDGHSLRFEADKTGEVLTLAKTCEMTEDIRYCSNNKDWSILALQNIRTGKAHYLVICQCPKESSLEGPLAQTGAPYARVPGIRVYGMLCLKKTFRRRGKKYPGFFDKNPGFSKTSLPVSTVPKFPAVWKTIAQQLSES